MRASARKSGGSTFMNDRHRDILISEMHADIRWLKQASAEHRQTHARYVWYFISTLVAIFLCWFR